MKMFLVGIKGSGMSALALYLKGLGHEVSGSDVEDYIFTEDKLLKQNIKIYNFSYKEYDKYDIIIRGNSIENIINSISYTEAINVFKKGKLISVAGTHGKTTTSTILSQLLRASYIIGDGSGEYINSDYFILESCEYKDTFLNYNPEYSIITSIDYDHVDYFKKEENIINSFCKFIDKSKINIVCQDLIEIDKKGIMSYGYKLNLKIIEKKRDYTLFTLDKKVYKTNLIGEHNISNLAGCLLLLKELKQELNVDKLMYLRMPKNRFEVVDNKYTDIILDYAHHPVEIEATLKSVKQKYPSKDIVIVFQEHTYSRTNEFFEEFEKIFKNYNTYICPIFGSNREEHNENYKKLSGKDYVTEFNIKKYLNSVVVYMGAGDIYNLLNYL